MSVYYNFKSFSLSPLFSVDGIINVIIYGFCRNVKQVLLPSPNE